ncbi:MAG TPA: PDZ domain-containing protein [Pyrinomonadaceae bacterium]
MIRRSLAFLFVSFVVFVAANAQTPTPGARAETKTFSMFFDGDASYLGVQTEEVTKENLAKYGLREVRGVAVEKVMEGSPAEKAGLQNGDVIVRLGNEEITSVRKLTRMLGEISADHQVKITVLRGGNERELVATLGKRPMPKFEEGAFSMNMPRVPFPPGEFPTVPRGEQFPRVETLPPGTPATPFGFGFWSGRRIGIGVTTLTKQLSDHFGVAGGLMINEVRADSPAAKAGLKAGDIIIEADGKEVRAEGDLIRRIQETKGGDVNLTIIRDRNRQTIRVAPEEVKDGFNSFYVFPTPPDAPQRSLLTAPLDLRWVGPGSLFPILRFPNPIH